MKKLFVLAAALTAALALPLQSANAQVTINEVYGGGGNAGAPFNQDFVELFNNGASAFDLSGFSLQYAAPAGTFTNLIVTFASGTFIPAGSTFLISSGPIGATGAALPMVNVVGAGVNIGGVNGAVRLFNPTTMAVIDLVGYGTAAAGNFEGLAAAPAGTNSTSIQRIAPGVDTNQNAVDFTTGAPTPVAAIPEPGTYMLLGIGVLMCAQQFRRRNRNK